MVEGVREDVSLSQTRAFTLDFTSQGETYVTTDSNTRNESEEYEPRLDVHRTIKPVSSSKTVRAHQHANIADN